MLRYTPLQHGEHGVDATLHMLLRNQSEVHEVFCNPPGGSWTRFEILRPQTGESYLWDHMPRVPTNARRPDSVLQFNKDGEINFLLVESKQSIKDIAAGVGASLKRFFTGSTGYIGLRDRPAWHLKTAGSDIWQVIPSDSREDVRYWLKKYPGSLVHFWGCFAFAIEPEYHREIAFKIGAELAEKMTAQLKESDLDMIVAIGWRGLYHEPTLLSIYSDEFSRTTFSRGLKRLLAPAEVG